MVGGLSGFRKDDVGGMANCVDSVVLWVPRDAMVVKGLMDFRMKTLENIYVLFFDFWGLLRCHGRGEFLDLEII
ncbi:uncharacterized protein N7515_004739 [Penicillium bovifimosum]|uniref:Uncharacterized protein n=1 Tax=Penicillium bovifimosum TaxID=126998 RepID=A0A9W9H0P5_9EURO|nr:uncharacterized protein N7515_004739 [Penicillium bovifimosum]KAJ5135461.1 hypothetical protein N7515_004739 [Penicillium bovifimosum]